MGDKDIVILKTITNPSIEEFFGLIRAARKQAKEAGLKRSDIARAVIKYRKKE